MPAPEQPSDGNAAIAGVPAVGEIIAGKYQVERVLGVGGMGVVVAAQHAQLGHAVAIKFLLPQALQQEGAVARFLREARSAVRLQSEHVVRIMDVDTLDNGSPYVVMELLAGSDLSQVLEARGPLPVSEAVDYVIQACDAIAEAHSVGIVHRDLKPANLFLTQRPDGAPLVKVLDFGISKSTNLDDKGQSRNLTATTALMGSPLYMSPEQVRSAKNVDRRTDVWALGVIIQELVTGQVPFEADSALGVCAKIIGDPPTRPREQRPDVPPDIEAVILACLEKDPADRLQNVGALARALARFASPEGATLVDRIAKLTKVSTVPPPLGAARTAATPETATLLPAERSEPHAAPGGGTVAPLADETPMVPPRRRGALVAVIVGALVVVVVAVAAVLVMGRDGHRPAGPAAPAPMPVAIPSQPPVRPAAAPGSGAAVDAGASTAAATTPPAPTLVPEPPRPSPSLRPGRAPGPKPGPAKPTPAAKPVPSPTPVAAPKPPAPPELPKPPPPKKPSSTELPDDWR